MDLLIYNIGWMSWNIFLGLLAVIFGWFMIKSSSFILKIFFACTWLLFVPNTIYIITDLIHVPKQILEINGWLTPFLILQYILLILIGVASFVISVYFFEKTIRHKTFRLKERYIFSLLVFTNFVIAFGVVVGRVQRTNSWEVFTNLGRVIEDAFNVFFSPQLIFTTLIMGLIGNLFYFFLKNPVIAFYQYLCSAIKK